MKKKSLQFSFGLFSSFFLGLFLFLSSGVSLQASAPSGNSVAVCNQFLRALSPATGFSYGENETWVAVVNGVSSGKRFAGALRARGYRVLHISTYPQNEFPEMWIDSFNPNDYDALLEFDQAKPQALLDQLKAFSISGVISGSEEATPYQEWLSIQLGLPVNGWNFENRDQFDSNPRRNKYEMNEQVRRFDSQNPIRVARQILTNDFEELTEWKNSVHSDWPVILKPHMSSGQDSVYKCYDWNCLKRAFDSIQGKKNLHGHLNTAVLVQEFLEGEEFIVETVTVNGQHHFAYSFKYDAVPVPGTSALTHTATLLPLGHPFESALAEYAFRVNDALGIHHGSAHHEVMRLKSGEIVLIEVGPRLAGGDLPYWVRQATGFDEVNLNIDAYLNPEAFFVRWEAFRSRALENEKSLKEVLLKSLSEGRLMSYEMEEQIRGLRSFQNLYWRYPEGTQLEVSTNLRNVLAYVILMHEDPQVVEEDYALLRQWESEERFSQSAQNLSLVSQQSNEF